MRHIYLISCVSRKRLFATKAADLYTSTLFTKALAYAKSQKPDAIFILSAKHGLLRLSDFIPPYNETLNTMGVKELRAWGVRVREQLAAAYSLERDNFTFLAGRNYRKELTPYMPHYEVPMEGLIIGQQLSWLNKKLGI